MATKRRKGDRKRPAGIRSAGRFLSKDDQDFARREIAQRKLDKQIAAQEKKLAALRKQQDTMQTGNFDTRLGALFERGKRKRTADGKRVSTEILERLQRTKTKEGKTRKGLTLGEIEYQRGPYRVLVFRTRGTEGDARIAVKDWLEENSRRGDRSWLNVTSRGQSIGTTSATPEKTYQRVDTFTDRKYIRFAFQLDADEEPTQVWEVVIVRKT